MAAERTTRSETAPGGELTPMRRRLFGCVMLLGVVVVVELLSYGLLRWSEGRWLGPIGLGSLRDVVASALEESAVPVPVDPADEDDRWNFRHQEVIHPFLGFVGDYESSRFGKRADLSEEGRNHGFFLNHEKLFHEPSPDRLVVVVLGGSFAQQTFFFAWESLAQRLEEAAPGHEIVVLGIAAGGYKQPQQLAALNWFLSLGLHADVVINLDGFNEVGLPLAENTPMGVDLFFPRSWALRVSELDPQRRRLTGEVVVIEKLRARALAASRIALCRWSATCTFAWRRVDARLAHEIGDREQTLVAVAGEQLGFQARGAGLRFATNDERYDALADVWARSSLLMHQICVAQGIAYFHFLQPNQYVEGSKPLSEDELANAYNPGLTFARGVRLGYPRLLAHGADLQSRGVAFHSLIDLFADETETVYADKCCHLEHEDYATVSRRIGDLVGASPAFAAQVDER